MFSICCSKKNKNSGRKTRRKTKIKPFVDKCNWEGINYPSEKDDRKKYKKINLTITLNVLYAKKENKYPAYVSNRNSHKEQPKLNLL